MMSRHSAGAATIVAMGALILVPADGRAQQEVFRQDPCSAANVVYTSQLQAVISCAATGYAPDQFRLGVMFSYGIDVPENDAEAARWFRMAAEQGHPAAQHDLGWKYATGDGIPEDDSAGVYWY